jgi:hypothetical protein
MRSSPSANGAALIGHHLRAHRGLHSAYVHRKEPLRELLNGGYGGSWIREAARRNKEHEGESRAVGLIAKSHASQSLDFVSVEQRIKPKLRERALHLCGSRPQVVRENTVSARARAVGEHAAKKSLGGTREVGKNAGVHLARLRMNHLAREKRTLVHAIARRPATHADPAREQYARRFLVRYSPK